MRYVLSFLVACALLAVASSLGYGQCNSGRCNVAPVRSGNVTRDFRVNVPRPVSTVAPRTVTITPNTTEAELNVAIRKAIASNRDASSEDELVSRVVAELRKDARFCGTCQTGQCATGNCQAGNCANGQCDLATLQGAVALDTAGLRIRTGNGQGQNQASGCGSGGCGILRRR